MEQKHTVPKCVGIIMDGNRRFARRNGRPLAEGHAEGYEKVKELFQWVKTAGIRHVVLYAFSTENWNRDQEEVSSLMRLLHRAAEHELLKVAGEDIRIHVAGDRSRFSPDIQNALAALEQKTAHNIAHHLWLALSYGGRAEIVHACNELLREGARVVTEKDIERHLWTSGMPDPDMIIRTSGEERLSGFLPWQSVYSELFFTPTLWPDFSKEEFFAMLEEYAHRERRRGA